MCLWKYLFAPDEYTLTIFPLFSGFISPNEKMMSLRIVHNHRTQSVESGEDRVRQTHSCHLYQEL